MTDTVTLLNIDLSSWDILYRVKSLWNDWLIVWVIYLGRRFIMIWYSLSFTFRLLTLLHYGGYYIYHQLYQ
jgi:hypothetical protein